MGEVVVEAMIAKPRAEVWHRLRDLRMARHYVAGVTAIEFNSGPREGIGASRKVFMKGRSPVDETAIAWEDGRGFTLKIHNGNHCPAPFKWATFQYVIEDAPDARTLFCGRFSYEMAGGLFGRLLELFVVRPALKRSNAALGPNMKTFYETGQITNPALVSSR
jgi:Polyketide cyclase / dehydrase and lipid transport